MPSNLPNSQIRFPSKEFKNRFQEFCKRKRLSMNWVLIDLAERAMQADMIDSKKKPSMSNQNLPATKQRKSA